MTVAAVAGGARGIGLAIAQRLSKGGATVALDDLDAAESSSFAKFLDEVERACGPIDVLVEGEGQGRQQHTARGIRRSRIATGSHTTSTRRCGGTSTAASERKVDHG